MLCPQEDLPPDTIHHYATYLAVFACIDEELMMEMEDPDCVGADLLEENQPPPPPPSPTMPKRTPQEMKEHETNMLLVENAAEKGAKNLKKRNTSLSSSGAENDNEEFFVPATPRSKMISEVASICQSAFSKIFKGGPCSEEDRRPPRKFVPC